MLNFPNLTKEINFQEVQEAQRAPKKLDLRRNTPRHIIITLPKIKDKERILKASRGKETITYKGVPIKTISRFHKRNLASKKGLERSIQSHERQGPTSKITVSSKPIIQNGRADKVFPRKLKLKECIITKPLLQEMLQGLFKEKEDQNYEQ